MENKKGIFAASGLLLATALFSTQPVVAASTLTFTGFEYGSVDVNFGTSLPLPPAVVTHANAGALNASINGGPSFEAFCVDVWQTFSFNHNYSLGAASNYTYRPSMLGYVTNAGALTQGTLDNLSRLYTEAHSSIIGNATNSAAFQLALWEIAYETPGNYNLTSGNFHSTGPAGVTSVANGWLLNLANFAPSYSISGYVSENYQDVIVFHGVPEPETYAMLLAGLGLMGFVARRRRGSTAV
ncbi:MAG: PEP-CTERM sorting domain-containing protein [Betaproteobacteria bacterium]